jgi:hypothetical protein
MGTNIEGLGITRKQFVLNNIRSIRGQLKDMRKKKEAYQDFLSLAQQAFKMYLLVELETGYNTTQYKRLLKRGRKGLGYSYP